MHIYFQHTATRTTRQSCLSEMFGFQQSVTLAGDQEWVSWNSQWTRVWRELLKLHAALRRSNLLSKNKLVHLWKSELSLVWDCRAWCRIQERTTGMLHCLLFRSSSSHSSFFFLFLFYFPLPFLWFSPSLLLSPFRYHSLLAFLTFKARKIRASGYVWASERDFRRRGRAVLTDNECLKLEARNLHVDNPGYMPMCL